MSVHGELDRPVLRSQVDFDGEDIQMMNETTRKVRALADIAVTYARLTPGDPTEGAMWKAWNAAWEDADEATKRGAMLRLAVYAGSEINLIPAEAWEVTA